MGTALVTGIVVYIYAKLASLPRKVLIGSVLTFFASNFFAWWWIARHAETIRAAGTGTWGWTSPVFYVWTDVFSIMAVTIFWMYANDVFPPQSAKRIFGVIGAAGPAGGIVGAFLTKSLVAGLGTVNMVLVGAAIYVVALLIFLGLETLTRGKSADRGEAAQKFEEGEANLGELPAVLRLIKSTRFLLFLTLVVCFERMVPDFADFIQSTIGKAAFPARDAYTAWFANIEFLRNIAAFVATLFFTAAILNLLGVKVGLSANPVSILVLGAVFLLQPVLLVAVLLKNVDEGQRHSWFKAAKETTYTATSREVIYRVKGYIEMFFYRLSRGIAGVLLLGISAAVAAAQGVPMSEVGTSHPVALTRAIALGALPLAALWLYCTWNLGKEFEKVERRVESKAPAGAQQPAAAR
jgi:AAA family ATP:ADP antiporter